MTDRKYIKELESRCWWAVKKIKCLKARNEELEAEMKLLKVEMDYILLAVT